MAKEKWLHTVAKTGNYSDLLNKPRVTSETSIDDETILASAKSIKKLNDIVNTKANSSHTHSKSQITDMPSALKNPTALTLQFNGATNKTYDGSAAQTVNITPGAIGASPSNHTHNYAGSTSAGGSANSANKLSTARNITIGNTKKTFDGSADVSWNLNEIGAANSSHVHDERYYTESEIDSKVNALNKSINDKASSNHTHTKSQITDMPSTLKNPNALTVQFNGTNTKTYDGSTAQTLNITPGSIGAVAQGESSYPTMGSIELSAPTPFIDFHFGRSSEDYTSRIIEDKYRHLSIYANNGVDFSGNIRAQNHIYEEGNWTPGIFGANETVSVEYHSRYGWYKRINNMVFFAGYVHLKGYHLSGYIHINGIPYTPLPVTSLCTVNMRNYSSYTNEPLFGEVTSTCAINILSGSNKGISADYLESGTSIQVSGFYAIG